MRSRARAQCDATRPSQCVRTVCQSCHAHVLNCALVPCRTGMPAATKQLQRSATFLLCAYHVLRERVGFCREQLPLDVKVHGVVAWAVYGSQEPEPVELRPACGPVQMLDVDVLWPRTTY